jgi:peptidoglycan hydrolase-like protein with peptidoglycan-binding domain
MSASSEQSARRLSGVRVRPRWLVLGAVVVAGAVVAIVVASRGGSNSPSATASTATATVARRDLVDRASESGELDYADKTTLAGKLQGTVTWLPDEGSTVHRGGTLYRVDDEPVALMYGHVPVWRAFSSGMSDGPDVKELERNLAKLGYDPGTVDDHFSSSTASAVKAWQKDEGLDQTGSVDLGRVVFAAGAQRIGQVTASIGGQASGPLMGLSSTRHVATANIDAAQQTLVHKGDPVLVELPSGDDVRGRISNVSRVAKSSQQANSGATIAIEVSFSTKTHLPDLDQAPVTIKIAQQRERNALSVPITALIAQPGAGFTVEVVHSDGRHTFVPVQTGLFASGYVQVSGSGLEPGTRVVVPQ